MQALTVLLTFSSHPSGVARLDKLDTLRKLASTLSKLTYSKLQYPQPEVQKTESTSAAETVAVETLIQAKVRNHACDCLCLQ